MNFRNLALAVGSFGALAAAIPASALPVTFATFSDLTTKPNIRLLSSGNSPTRLTDATIFSTPNGVTAGTVDVRFSFLQPEISAFVTNVVAAFTLNAVVPKNDPATTIPGGLDQAGITGSFSFISTTAITISGPHFVTHTYAAGSNLLSGVFTPAAIFGAGSSASLSGSTEAGEVLTLTSDFLNFANTINRDGSISITAINPGLTIHTGANKALNSFRGTAGGQFSSDPAPLINGLVVVPEPGVWMLMVAGFGMVGVSVRRRERSVAA